jgi:hypothetical protein
MTRHGGAIGGREQAPGPKRPAERPRLAGYPRPGRVTPPVRRRLALRGSCRRTPAVSLVAAHHVDRL